MEKISTMNCLVINEWPKCMLAFTYKHIYIHTQMVETMNNYVTESVMAAKTYSTVWQICFKFDLFLMKAAQRSNLKLVYIIINMVGEWLQQRPAKPNVEWMNQQKWIAACDLQDNLSGFKGIAADLTKTPVSAEIGSIQVGEEIWILIKLAILWD